MTDDQEPDGADDEMPRPDWRGIRESAVEDLAAADAAVAVTITIDDGEIDESAGSFVNHEDLSEAEIIGVSEILKAGLQEELDRLPDVVESRSSSEPTSLLEHLAESGANVTAVSMDELVDEDEDDQEADDRGKGGIFR